jgi:hypothetical protein
MIPECEEAHVALGTGWDRWDAVPGVLVDAARKCRMLVEGLAPEAMLRRRRARLELERRVLVSSEGDWGRGRARAGIGSAGLSQISGVPARPLPPYPGDTQGLSIRQRAD